MNILFVVTFLFVLLLISAFMGGIFLTSLRNGLCPTASLREAVIWGSSFIVYAVADYLLVVPSPDYLLTTH
ncbi:MAG: hypothetical protein HY306_01725 [Nitrosomonadales bacterium]|nr:hypothetical protein [Nitrosomonadales bacterium]